MKSFLRTLRVVLSIIAFVTLLLPIDLLPDVTPLIGWIDDLLALIFLAHELSALIRGRSTPTRSTNSPRNH